MQARSSEVVLLLGSNIGDRESRLQKAKDRLRELAGVVSASSIIYESEPWGFDAETPFLNQAIMLNTDLGPRTLLQTVWKIEKELGRERVSDGYSSRTIDIDILTWWDKIVWTTKLQIPHIQLQNRKFALLPLTELQGGKKHPLLNKTYRELLLECEDTTWVKPFVPSHV